MKNINQNIVLNWEDVSLKVKNFLTQITGKHKKNILNIRNQINY